MGTVEFRSNGPASNKNPSITDARGINAGSATRTTPIRVKHPNSAVEPENDAAIEYGQRKDE